MKLGVKVLSSSIFLFILFPSIVFPLINANGAVTSPPQQELAPNLLENGYPALDWTLKELISDKSMSFSSFAGKVVLVDFMATWCGPCIDAIPTLKEVYNHFKSDDFVMISLSVDPDYDDEYSLEDFALDYDMDWYIFRDASNYVVGDYYQIEFIPTLYIFNQYQYVYFSEVGVGEAAPLIDVIDPLLAMNDTDPPSIDNFATDKSSFSVLDPEFTVSADLTDTELRLATFELTFGDYYESRELWAPDNGTSSCKFSLDPLIPWSASQNGTTSATIDLTVDDFADHNVTAQTTISIDNIPDNNPPNVTITAVEDTVGSFGQNVEVYATVTDDILVTAISAEVWLNGKLNDSKEMTLKPDESYYVKFFNIKVSPQETVEIKVIAEDISGKTTTETQSHIITGAAETSKSGLALPTLLILLLSGLVAIPMRRLIISKKR